MRDLKNMIMTLFLGIFSFAIAFCAQYRVEQLNYTEKAPIISSDSPPCLQLFYAIEKYAEEYNIPKNYAYGIAFYETRYSGPFHWNYDHVKLSSAGAVGPMQIMINTAKGLFPEKHVTREFLQTDIDFNVHCSMKLLRRLYDKHHNWKLVFGAYNTGRPIVNLYAEQVYSYKR